MLKISELTIEYSKQPIGLDVTKPRFSWILESEQLGVVQEAYSLQVLDDSGVAWDTGLIKSEKSVLIEYLGKELKPKTTYKVRLKVNDNHGNSAVSETIFETGLISHRNMSAKWITHGYEDKTEPCPIYIKDFRTKGEIKSARIYAGALGLYQLNVNGQKVGDAFFAPGWTSYTNRLQYQTYDITALLKDSNRVEITSANGWYSGELGFEIASNHYGSRTAVWAQIEISYSDGSSEMILTDDSWSYGTGPIRYSEIYHGETIDNNYSVGIDGTAVNFDHPVTVLIAQECEPVRITKRIKPVETITTPKGELVFDFGQNLVGIVEARLDCAKGTAVTLKHAEVLDKDGNFYTENLRAARCTDTFICKGGGDVFLPTFTFHGFRYLKIEGAAPDANDLTACVLHTDMEHTGSFSCSHEAVNRLWQNIQWGQRGNFLDIPTDCPQRDERLGWTGDAQVFASTAAYNFNTARFFTKWLRDLAAEQTLEKGVPHVIPNILGPQEGAAAWSDAATVIPWTMYETYGDTRILEEQYESMKMWVEYIRSKAGESHLWQSGFQYGDWVALDKEEGSDRVGATDVYLIATAYYAYSTSLVAKAAEILGKSEDFAKYAALHEKIKVAFQKEYITETGRMVSETQTGCLLALHFNLAQERHRARIMESLLRNLQRHNNHLTTGFVGTPMLCHVLSDNSQHEMVGTVFLKRDYPSWLYSVDMGATTIWERWNSMKPDGTFDESGMNSFNHYAYGAVGGWMVQKLAGINILESGYKMTRIEPMPIKGITFVEASLKTAYGLLSVRWKCKGRNFTASITVPVNTTAIVKLPGNNDELTLGSGEHHFEHPTDMQLEYERYSMESTLGELFDNPVALGILKQYAPDIADNPMIKFALGMSISQMLPRMPEGGGQLFEMAIAAANKAENSVKDIL